MPHLKKFFLSILICLSLIISIQVPAVSVKASDTIAFVILSQYKAEVDIGDEFYLFAVATNGEFPSFKSSNSKVASVNTYGTVTAKKAGTAVITAKVKNGEASCRVTVNKTRITISRTSASFERGATLTLTAATSNGSAVTWKSSKKSVAVIDENGVVTGVKPGETVITASADASTATCKITVKTPTVKLNNSKVSLYRGQTYKLNATVSSSISPKWKTNKKSVATVDETGTVTAVKHGTATITAEVDGVTKSCEVEVKQPDITLSKEEISIKAGGTVQLTAKVSSGNQPVWSSSNLRIAKVDAAGTITAVSKGRAYIYAAEDGVRAKCTVYVTE